MNKKQYIKWQIKEMLPMYIISFIILGAIFWLTISTSELMPTKFKNYETGDYYISLSVLSWPPLFAILIPALLLSFFLPYSSFIYQRKRIYSDFYYQLPFKKNELRRTNLLISYTILTIAITIIYWIGILYIFIRQIQLNATDEYFVANNFYYNYVYFIPYYFVLLLGTSLNYFISSFFISLGTKSLDSLLYLIFGQLILAFMVETFLILILVGAKNSDSTEALLNAVSYTPSPSWLENVRSTMIFCDLAMRGSVSLEKGDIITRIVSSSAYLLLGGFLTWYMLFKKKDPSGEDAGKGVPTTPISKAIPHAFALMSGLYISCSFGLYGSSGIGNFWLYLPMMLMEMIMWGVAYYFYMVMANGGFHFKKKNWIAFASVTSIVVILGFVYLLIYAS